MHSSQTMTDALFMAIRLGLPSAKDYLEKRIVRAEHPLLAYNYPDLNMKHVMKL